MEIDPMREIRKIRSQISDECGNDSEKVFDYYQSQQERLKASGKYTFVATPLPITPAGLAKELNKAPKQK